MNERFDPNYGETDWSIFIALLTRERGARAIELLRAGGFTTGVELIDPRDRCNLGLDLVTAEWLRYVLMFPSANEAALMDRGAPHLQGELSWQARQDIVDSLDSFIANANASD